MKKPLPVTKKIKKNNKQTKKNFIKQQPTKQRVLKDKIYQKNNTIQVEGHRGISLLWPHNTLISYQKAIEIGIDGVELDTWLTKDGTVIVIHGDKDDKVEYKGQNYFIYDLTLSQLKEIILPCNQRIPTLEEVFILTKNKIRINIELKGEQKDLSKEILKLVIKHDMFKQIWMSSFWHPHYEFLLKAMEEMKVNKNSFSFGFLFWKMEEKPNIEKIDSKNNYLNFPAEFVYNEQAKQFLTEAKKKGFKLCCYFSHKIKETYQYYKDLIDFGVKIIITNMPITLSNYVKSLK